MPPLLHCKRAAGEIPVSTTSKGDISAAPRRGCAARSDCASEWLRGPTDTASRPFRFRRRGGLGSDVPGGNNRRLACKPGSVPPANGRGRSFIWSDDCSSDQATYPGFMTGRTSPHPLFGLAPGGVYRADRSPGRWCALTAPFHPYLIPLRGEGHRRCTFCCTVPILPERKFRSVGRWELPTTASCGARTFLRRWSIPKDAPTPTIVRPACEVPL